MGKPLLSKSCSSPQALTSSGHHEIMAEQEEGIVSPKFSDRGVYCIGHILEVLRFGVGWTLGHAWEKKFSGFWMVVVLKE